MSDLFHDKNISPMLLNEVKEPFDDKDYIYELKLDGIRCIAYLGKDVVLQNKRFKDVTAIYPELSDMSKCLKKNTVLDGELVLLSNGKPDFYALQKRSLMGDKFRIQLAAKKQSVQFAAYDILYYNGKDLTDKPLMERKAILQEKVTEGNGLSIRAISKKRGSRFLILQKSRNWRESSQRRRTDCIISESARAIG